MSFGKLEEVEIAHFTLNPSKFSAQDVNTQLRLIGKKIPYRGEMELYQDGNEATNPTNDPNKLRINVFGFWEKRSTWLAIGAGAAGLAAGFMFGKRR